MDAITSFFDRYSTCKRLSLPVDFCEPLVFPYTNTNAHRMIRELRWPVFGGAVTRALAACRFGGKYGVEKRSRLYRVLAKETYREKSSVQEYWRWNALRTEKMEPRAPTAPQASLSKMRCHTAFARSDATREIRLVLHEKPLRSNLEMFLYGLLPTSLQY